MSETARAAIDPSLEPLGGSELSLLLEMRALARRPESIEALAPMIAHQIVQSAVRLVMALEADALARPGRHLPLDASEQLQRLAYELRAAGYLAGHTH